jgi:hypothetical protein
MLFINNDTTVQVKNEETGGMTEGETKETPDTLHQNNNVHQNFNREYSSLELRFIL